MPKKKKKTIKDFINSDIKGSRICLKDIAINDIARDDAILIYPEDTAKFYRTFKKEIQKIINEKEIDIYKLQDFDLDDKLVLNAHNQKLLSWWAYDVIAKDLLVELGIDKALTSRFSFLQ